jgi:hypothetical protein
MKPKGNINTKKDFRGSRRRGNFSREKTDEKKVTYICGLCEKEIQDISTALAIPATGSPAHFDCVLKKITETEKLEAGQQVVYLGGGSFGIIKTEANASRTNFKIIKKIEFEEREKVPDWRKELVRIRV